MFASAWCEAALRYRIVINLKSGPTFSFPLSLTQGLTGTSPEDLAEVEVTPSGDGLHWEKLDADFNGGYQLLALNLENINSLLSLSIEELCFF